MAVFQCKSCGANLNIRQGARTVVCDYCGTMQTPFEKTSQDSADRNEEVLLMRAFLSLEEGEFEKADHFCEQVLNLNPENAEAYFCKLLVELKLTSKEKLNDYVGRFEDSKNYKRLRRFADEPLNRELDAYMQKITDNYNEVTYQSAVEQMQTVDYLAGYRRVMQMLQSIQGYKDSAQLYEECRILAADAQRKETYTSANFILLHSNDPIKLQEAKDQFRSLNGWKDSNQKIAECEHKMKEAARRSRLWFIVSVIVLIFLFFLVYMYTSY